MAFELNFKSIFQDFNPSLLVFSLLFALRSDGTIFWSYWIVFLPLWVWKGFVLIGAGVASWVWWRRPAFRMEGNSYTQYKAVIITTGLHLLLLMFELLACDKLESNRRQVLWALVFIPVLFMSIISIGICVWAVKHESSFELELFCAVNILQFVFIALRLDGFIMWQWVVVFVPLWILLCLALFGVLYAIILALILLKSPELVPAQRRGNIWSAVAYTCLVVPFLVFLILLANKLDGTKQLRYLTLSTPLFISLITLILLSFGAKGWNQWWFGLRRDFCPFLLGICPLLQEYGNISYKLQTREAGTAEPADQDMERTGVAKATSKRTHRKPDDGPVVPVLSIDAPD